MDYTPLIGTEAGLITDNLITIPNRNFLPKGLYQVACQSENLAFAGFELDSVNGSSIGFDYQKAYMSALGEYFERYCAGYQRKNLVQATYDVIRERGVALHPDKIALYADWQYAQPDFPFKKFTTNDEVAWVEAYDLCNKEPIWVPAFYGLFTHSSKFYDKNVKFMQSTSTGLAAGPTVERAIEGAFLESAERHAFTSFWYNQRRFFETTPIYSQESILNSFPKNKQIATLFRNSRVKMYAIDLADFGSVETIVTIMFFPYKGKILMSLGAASRFTKEEAIVKSALEAYQGVEYVLVLQSRHKEWLKTLTDYSTISDFGKHFVFYSAFPELRKQVPILKFILEHGANGTTQQLLEANMGKMKSMQDFHKSGAEKIIYLNLSLPDIQDIGFHSVRVLVPGWSYLTAWHKAPFLGADVFKDKNDLFTELPHPFP
jgi:ribosomal protein S12 methylthiotransferase accessory factor